MSLMRLLRNSLLFILMLFQPRILLAKNQTFKWSPTVTAHRAFPMRLLSGHFITANGGLEGLPPKSMIDYGWGELGVSFLTGSELKAVPQKLNIEWFSYSENKFYSGTFNLNSEEIEKLFHEESASPEGRNEQSYGKIMVGLAPEGHITVWAFGAYKTRVIDSFKASENISIPWSRVSKNSQYSREQYVAEAMKESLSNDFLKEANKRGIMPELYESFPYKIVISGNAQISEIGRYFFNGEKDVTYSGEVKSDPIKKGILELIRIRWGTKRINGINIALDLQEQVNAISQLKKEEGNDSWALNIDLSSDGKSAKVFFKSKKSSIPLEKLKLQQFE